MGEPRSDRARLRKNVAAFIILTSLLASPFLLALSFKTASSGSNPINNWMPKTKVAQEFQQVAKRFRIARDQPGTILLSWNGCTADDPRLARLTESLGATRNSNSKSEWQLGHTALLIEQLIDQQGSLSRPALTARLAGSLVGRDGQTLVLSITPPQELARDLAIETLLSKAQQACGLPAEELHMLGPLVAQSNLDRETFSVFFPFSIFAAILTLTATWICLRSFVLVFLLMLSAMHGAASGLAIMAVAGVPMSALHTMLPAMWFVLGISASTHLLNYLREAYEAGIAYPVAHAVQHAMRPCLSATATTIFGLFSLCVSNLVPVQEFGFWGAVGLTFAIVQIYLLLPAMLTFFNKRWLFGTQPASTWLADTAHAITGRYHLPLLIGGSLLTVFCVLGFSRLEIVSGFYPLFADTTKIKQDLHWYEEVIGPQGNLQVVLRFDGTDKDRFMNQLRLCFDLSQELEQRLPGCECLSAGHMVALPNPQAQGMRASIQRSVLRAKLFGEKQRFVESGSYSEVEGAQFLINLFIPVAWENDTQLPERVRQVVAAFAENSEANKQVEITVTGGAILTLDLQHELLASFTQSTFYAALVVVIAIVIGLRSFKLAGMAILPNAFPILFAFGLLGWLGFPIDLGSIMTSSIALGIADDDTFHYLVSYQRQSSHPSARLDAMRETCPAMIQSSLICGAGMLVFLFSDFVPAARFGTLLAAILAAALLGDLVILSAELALLDRFARKVVKEQS